jgi:hypothetical protein
MVTPIIGDSAKMMNDEGVRRLNAGQQSTFLFIEYYA